MLRGPRVVCIASGALSCAFAVKIPAAKTNAIAIRFIIDELNFGKIREVVREICKLFNAGRSSFRL